MHITSQFFHGILQGGKSNSGVVTALKCLYEGQQASAPNSAAYFKLELFCSHLTVSVSPMWYRIIQW